MKLNLTAAFSLTACLLSLPVAGQNPFTNLNFELAQLPILQPGEVAFPNVTDALPGWNVFLGPNQLTTLRYNQLTLGSPAVSVIGPNFTQFGPIPPLEGQFSVVLFGGSLLPASISQSGVIPLGSQSIQLQTSLFGGGSENFVLSLNGTPIILLPLDGTHTLYGGDISGFAGQLTDLRISAAPTGSNLDFGSWVDAIAFSPMPVPEPRFVALLAVGGLLLGLRQWRKSRRE